MFDTANAPRPVGVDEDVRAGSSGDPVIDRARRLQALLDQRRALFPEPVMADGAMAAMLMLFLAQCEGRTVTRASVTGGQTIMGAKLLDGDRPDDVIASLLKAGLVRTGSEADGGPAAGDENVIALTPMGSARMRSYLGDHSGIEQ